MFVFSLIPSQARADLLPLVQCGITVDDPCTFCDFFGMINRIIQFVMSRIVPVVAVLMLLAGGIIFFFAGGSPKALATAKGIITSTIIGLVVIFAAFLIVGTILSAIGLAGWTSEIYKSWWSEGFFQIPCD